MAATSMAITIKEEPKENGVQDNIQNDVAGKGPVTLDYNAIFGNMYRDFLANNTSSASGVEANTTTTTTATAESSKVFIPPECYAESFDIQDVVNEFKVTLEKFGVSQRFAAKYIMEDTSQGNLSFLMDKGKRLKWAELSPKGRIPYVKMKQWLDSREKQANTIDMVKENKAMTRQNASRDAFQRRERFSLFQLTVLCRLFEENSNPSMTTRQAIADKLSIPPERINVWFQNQRARGFPAKRILQQSFHSASSTNGAARSASIMNSVAMEIVNQSKTDSLLANNTVLVNQYVENSLFQNEADDSDVHRLLLQYSSPSDQLKALGPSLSRNRDTSPLPSNKGGKRSRGGSRKSNNSGENHNISKVKTELDTPSDCLNELDIEMTSNEKVNGYLSHLNQSQSKSKSAYGSQLDSVVKRITQSHSSSVTQSHSTGSNHAHSGAAKRKPAFLNKVHAQPKGDAAVFDNYTSPYSPATTSTSVMYDSSPLSALYRQTASVNFTPPNPSFNYLFDIGSPAQIPIHPNFYTKQQHQGTIPGTHSEPRKRLLNEVTPDIVMDLKRKKTSNNTFSDSQQSDSSKDTDRNKTEVCSVENRANHKTNLQDDFDTMKVPVKILDKSVNFLNIPQPEKQDKDNHSKDNTSKDRKDNEMAVADDGHNTENEGADTVQRNFTDRTEQNTDNNQADNQNETHLSGKSAEGNENDIKESTDTLPNEAEEMVVENDTETSRKLQANSESTKDNTMSTDHHTKDNKIVDSDNEQMSDSSKQNTSQHETDKVCSNDSNVDKPLSKEEMEVFKSLYARFVKYHFAQMQFPDTK